MSPLQLQTETSSIVCLCAVEVWGGNGESRMGAACFQLQGLHHNQQVPAQMCFSTCCMFKYTKVCRVNEFASRVEKQVTFFHDALTEPQVICTGRCIDIQILKRFIKQLVHGQRQKYEKQPEAFQWSSEKQKAHLTKKWTEYLLICRLCI